MKRFIFYIKLFTYLITKINFKSKSLEEFFKRRTFHAKQFCIKEISRNSKNYYSRLLLAGLYRSERDCKSAIEHYSELLKNRYNDNRILYGLAVCLFNEEKYEQAELYLKNLINLSPNHKVAFGYLGRINLLKENYDEAIHFFQKSIQIGKTDSQIWENLAFCYFHIQDYEKSHELYLRAYNLNPTAELKKHVILAREALEHKKPKANLQLIQRPKKP